LVNTRLKKDDDGDPWISPSTAYAWMLRCGAKRSKGGKGYYTDLHERDDVKAYRVVYLHANWELNWRTAIWIQLTQEEYEREVTADEKMQVEKPFFFAVDPGEISGRLCAIRGDARRGVLRPVRGHFVARSRHDVGAMEPRDRLRAGS